MTATHKKTWRSKTWTLLTIDRVIWLIEIKNIQSDRFLLQMDWHANHCWWKNQCDQKTKIMLAGSKWFHKNKQWYRSSVHNQKPAENICIQNQNQNQNVLWQADIVTRGEKIIVLFQDKLMIGSILNFQNSGEKTESKRIVSLDEIIEWTWWSSFSFGPMLEVRRNKKLIGIIRWNSQKWFNVWKEINFLIIFF